VFNYLFAAAQADNLVNLSSDSCVAILQLDTSQYCGNRLKGFTQSNFNAVNWPIIDSLVNDFRRERINASSPFHCGVHIHDYTYYYQIIPLKDSLGQELIWIHAVAASIIDYDRSERSLTAKVRRQRNKGKLTHRTYNNWRNDIVCGYDGCGVFWEVKINIKNKSIMDIHISGV
jgi:hypothetical protein